MKMLISGNNSPCSTGAKECGCHRISRRTFMAALSGGIDIRGESPLGFFDGSVLRCRRQALGAANRCSSG